VLDDKTVVERAVVGEVNQQSRKQCAVGAGLQPQEQVCIPCGIGTARIDHHHARRGSAG
jgi:hypothetical protein